MLTIKGVRKQAEIVAEAGAGLGGPILTPTLAHQFRRPAAVVKQLLFHSLAEVWHEGWTPTVKIETIVKTLSRSFTDGEIGLDGRVRPWVLTLDQVARARAEPPAWHRAEGLSADRL